MTIVPWQALLDTANRYITAVEEHVELRRAELKLARERYAFDRSAVVEREANERALVEATASIGVAQADQVALNREAWTLQAFPRRHHAPRPPLDPDEASS